MILVNVPTRDHGIVPMTGELSAHPQMAITPTLHATPRHLGFGAGWTLTVIRTGRAVTKDCFATPDAVRDLARRLADLDIDWVGLGVDIAAWPAPAYDAVGDILLAHAAAWKAQVLR